MVVLAANISCRGTKYTFAGQFYGVLGSMLFNVVLVGLFAFAVIIRPTPIWNPQYVIPIVGMLLGNCTNGISLTMNNITIALVEQQREIELYLSFGATSYEAVSRLLREAVRSGTTPILNSMAVIGIISIPGMMTGQILGGSPVMEAARYQMLIMYLIAVCTFGVILMEVWVIVDVGFDSSHMLRPERFEKAPVRLNFGGVIWAALQSCSFGRTRREGGVRFESTNGNEMEPLRNSDVDVKYVAPNGRLEVQPMKETCGSSLGDALVLNGLTRSLSMEDITKTRTLFSDVSFTVGSGEISLVKGPSGCGKSQLLRSIAGLSPLDEGSISLEGLDWNNGFVCKSDWRKSVRYVTQYKVDIPGTPIDFIRRVASFKSWQRDPGAPTEREILKSTSELIGQWGLQIDCLGKEWAVLSGGESQRVIVALALASKPRVLLLDESTSALDLTSKTAVEHSVYDLAKKNGLKIVWVSHDNDQLERMNV